MSAPIADSTYDDVNEESAFDMSHMTGVVGDHWRLLVAGPIVAAVAGFGIASTLPPWFTARTTFLPPQQQSSSNAAAALASLGSLAGAAAGAAGIKTPGDQFASLLQSVTVRDRVIDKLSLMSVYKSEFRFQARNALESHVSISVGKKDGIITIDAEDHDPKRAAAIANQHVEELRRLTGTLAISEAQQRRVFFEGQLQQARDELAKAQSALQASGFSEGMLKAEPQAATEGYLALRSQLSAAQIRLDALRGSLSDAAPEVRQAQSIVKSLQAQIAKTESAGEAGHGSDYIAKYRDFKYRSELFELYARQFELARADEAREGAVIQVVDPATPPEHRSGPKRSVAAIVSGVGAFFALFIFLLARRTMRARRADDAAAAAGKR